MRSIGILFLFLSLSSISGETFENWSSANQTTGKENRDHDLYPDLLEYALDLDPTTGMERPVPQLRANNSGGLDFAYSAHPEVNVSVIVETSDDLKSWTRLETTEGHRNTQSPTQTIRNIDAKRTTGFVRLSVIHEDIIQTSPTLGWHHAIRSATRSTISTPFVKQAFFSSVIKEHGHQYLIISDPEFDPAIFSSTKSYLQILSGSQMGTCIDIDWESSSKTQVSLRKPLPSVSGAAFAIRPHTLITDIFDRYILHAGRLEQEADQVVFLRNGKNQLFSLIDEKGERLWVESSDAGKIDQGDKIIRPGEGLLFINRGGAKTELLLFGEVLTTPITLTFKKGPQLLGALSPIAQPFPENLIQPDDQLQIWQSSPKGRWVKHPNTPPLSNPFHAIYFNNNTSRSQWKWHPSQSTHLD